MSNTSANVEVNVNTEREKSNMVQMAQQIKKGELPSNEQIKAELDPAKELLLEKEKSAKSNQEAQVMHTTRKLVESVQETLEAKNPNDRIQKLTAAVARVAARTVPANSPHGLVRETTEFVNSLRDLVFDLAKSKEFRVALLNFFKLMRDVFKFQKKKAEEKMEEKGTKDKAEQAFIEGKPAELGAQVVEDTKQVLHELKIEDLPEDQKQRFRENLRALMNELKSHSDASFAFRKFLRLCSLLNIEFSAHLARAQVDADIKEIQDLTIDLISDLAGGRPVANFIAAVQKAVDKIQQDKELHNYLAECRDHINRGLENLELIAEEKYFNDAIELIKRGRAFAERYKNSNTFENLINETQDLIEAIKTDDNWSNIQYRANKVAESLSYTDLKGEKHIDFDLIGAMRRELVPFLIDRIKEVPVPGFKIENNDFEYLIVDELYVQIDDILPDKISIHARNDTDLSIKDFENPVKSESAVKFKMEGLRPAFKDMHFSFKRKGVVKLTDEGRANMRITGKGLSIYMDFDIDVDANNRAMLGKFKVQLKMDRVSIDITEAEHKILLNMLTTFFAPRVQKEIEASIKGRVEAIGGEWAMYINKRVLSTIPLPNLGQTVTKAIFP